MRIFTAADFNWQGSVALPAEGFVAAAIAPGSEVDICRIGSHVLGPRSIVPMATSCEALRGWRTGTLDDNAANVPPRIGGNLELLLFETCDELVVPGPRAPSQVSAIVAAGSYNPGGGASVLAMRLPFTGRDEAMIAIRRSGNAVTTTITMTIRGVRYLPRQVLGTFDKTNAAAITGSNPYYVESINALAYTLGTVPSNLDTEGGILLVGGAGDNQEAFDELEIWVQSANTTGDLWCSGESYGEHGV